MLGRGSSTRTRSNPTPQLGDPDTGVRFTGLQLLPPSRVIDNVPTCMHEDLPEGHTPSWTVAQSDVSLRSLRALTKPSWY